MQSSRISIGILPLLAIRTDCNPRCQLICCLCLSFQSKLAKALYDNIAECADELAFRKGDIVTVMDQNVAGTSGWWMCTLYGRQGLAPANRLQLLPQIGLSTAPWSHLSEKPKAVKVKTDDAMQNIYQIPSIPRPCSNQTYERMDMIYKVPFLTISPPKGPVPSSLTSEVNLLFCVFMFCNKCSYCVEEAKTMIKLMLICGQTVSRSPGSDHLRLKTWRFAEVQCCESPACKRVCRWGPGASHWGPSCSTWIFIGLLKTDKHRLQRLLTRNSCPGRQGPQAVWSFSTGTSVAAGCVNIYSHVHHFLSSPRAALPTFAVALNIKWTAWFLLWSCVKWQSTCIMGPSSSLSWFQSKHYIPVNATMQWSMGCTTLIKAVSPIKSNSTTCLSVFPDDSLWRWARHPSSCTMSRAKQEHPRLSQWASKHTDK